MGPEWAVLIERGGGGEQNQPTNNVCIFVIGRASLARENEAGGRRSIYSMLTYRTLLVLVVIIELSRNSVFQLSFPKDYYKQKQWNILPVTMITEIMNFNRLLWWLPW